MAEKLNIYGDQGATIIETFRVLDANSNPVSLSGYTGFSQIRENYAQVNAVAAFTVSVSNTSYVTLTLSATDSANLEAKRYVYDCEMHSDTTVLRVREGVLEIIA